jgi:beta-lactamase class A
MVKPPMPAPPEEAEAGLSVARAEQSLYASVLAIRDRHQLERLGIAFYDAETALQWSYNADASFHAASTMKLAVLLAVFRQCTRGELTLDEPVHVRNKFLSIHDRTPYRLDVDRDAEAEVYQHLGRTMSVGQLTHAMITASSNFATNLLVDALGVPVIQAALDELRIDGVKVLRGVEDHAAFAAGITTRVTATACRASG